MIQLLVLIAFLSSCKEELAVTNENFTQENQNINDTLKLVWSDEFDYKGAVDSSKWFHQTQLPNGYAWYNNEIQHYTDRIENAYVEDGVLNIAAINENYVDQKVVKPFSSARLNSKFAFKYGRVETRAKLPKGEGTWPAIWLLGKNINEKGAYWQQLGHGDTAWPQCGEIDIMEHWGTNQNFVQSAMHTPSSKGNTVNKGGQTIETVSDSFHVYTVDWTPEVITFSVDGKVHYEYAPEIRNDKTWPFDNEFYIILNLAIESMIERNGQEHLFEVDYVRVYQ